MSCGIVSRSACLPCGESKACGETLLTVSPMSCATAWLGISPFSHHYEHPPARLYHGVFVWPQFGLLQNLSKFSTWPFVCHFADPGFCRPVYAANNHDLWQLLFFSRGFLPEHGMCFVLLALVPAEIENTIRMRWTKAINFGYQVRPEKTIFLKSCWLQTCNINLFTNTKRM